MNEGADTLEQKDPAERPDAFVRRWLTEIALAEATESRWRDEADAAYKLFEAGEASAGLSDKGDGPARSFNVLWSNTETLLPAVYNSAPQPDVRRRFRDDDPVGKAASLVLERALSYTIDTEDFYDTLEDAVLDVLLPGRGIVRVKYEPKFMPQMAPAAPGAEPQPIMAPPPKPGVPQQPMMEKAYEKCLPEHVQWDDFTRGPGKRWSQVTWIKFRHRLKKDQLVSMFGQEIADGVKLNFPEGMENKQDAEKMAFATAEVYEVWDKETMTVFFLAPGSPNAPLMVAPDPMEIEGFWPIPKPMMAIKNSRSLVPRTLYGKYRVKAEELERISQRINSCVRIAKLRGVYDASLAELSALLDADHDDMIAVQNASRLYAAGGIAALEKAVWMMPIKDIAALLQVLYSAQNECKQTIYEITGISDVIRGATEASETATAQRLKAQFGGLRLKTLQREVRRFGRDLMRLMADVMCSKYDAETLASITGLDYPTGQEKAAAQAQLQQQQAMAQQQAAMAQMQGVSAQPPPPPDPKLEKTANAVSWDEIMSVLQNDRLRCMKVDVETDSTIVETLEADMEGLQQVLTALVGFIAPALPLVQQGMLTMDGLKSVALQIVRRARMGSAVEDAIEAMQAPAPPQPQAPAPDPMAGVQDAVAQIMEAMKKPRRIIAQADQTGRIEGELADS